MKRTGGIPLLAILIGFPQTAPADPENPAPPSHNRRFWFSEVVRHQNLLKAGQPRICFFGDSLTAFWLEQGRASWELEFEEFSPVNCGVAADRVEHIHHRIKLTAFGSTPPGVFIILAGTNNLGKDPPDDPESVSKGIHSLVKTVKIKCPDSKVVVLSILPSGTEAESRLRENINSVNGHLKTTAETSHGEFEFVDVHNRFLNGSGQWKDGLTIDGTHLTSKGYEVLGASIREKLKELLRTKG